jgi:hypothetical protein
MLLTARTDVQSRERWHNHLDLDVRQEAWTVLDDVMLIDLHDRPGNRWTKRESARSPRRSNQEPIGWSTQEAGRRAVNRDPAQTARAPAKVGWRLTACGRDSGVACVSNSLNDIKNATLQSCLNLTRTFDKSCLMKPRRAPTRCDIPAI